MDALSHAETWYGRNHVHAPKFITYDQFNTRFSDLVTGQNNILCNYNRGNWGTGKPSSFHDFLVRVCDSDLLYYSPNISFCTFCRKNNGWFSKSTQNNLYINHIDCLMEDCNKSSGLAIKLLKSTKSTIWAETGAVIFTCHTTWYIWMRILKTYCIWYSLDHPLPVSSIIIMKCVWGGGGGGGGGGGNYSSVLATMV